MGLQNWVCFPCRTVQRNSQTVWDRGVVNCPQCSQPCDPLDSDMNISQDASPREWRVFQQEYNQRREEKEQAKQADREKLERQYAHYLAGEQIVKKAGADEIHPFSWCTLEFAGKNATANPMPFAVLMGIKVSEVKTERGEICGGPGWIVTFQVELKPMRWQQQVLGLVTAMGRLRVEYALENHSIGTVCAKAVFDGQRVEPPSTLDGLYSIKWQICKRIS
ncbi:MAG TPA: hypothetical protein VIU46_02650 [Gallionellaceae bacterium]